MSVTETIKRMSLSCRVFERVEDAGLSCSAELVDALAVRMATQGTLFDEDDHPRDESGKFTSGGGAATKESDAKGESPAIVDHKSAKKRLAELAEAEDQDVDSFLSDRIADVLGGDIPDAVRQPIVDRVAKFVAKDSDAQVWLAEAAQDMHYGNPPDKHGVLAEIQAIAEKPATDAFRAKVKANIDEFKSFTAAPTGWPSITPPINRSAKKNISELTERIMEDDALHENDGALLKSLAENQDFAKSLETAKQQMLDEMRSNELPQDRIEAGEKMTAAELLIEEGYEGEAEATIESALKSHPDIAAYAERLSSAAKLAKKVGYDEGGDLLDELENGNEEEVISYQEEIAIDEGRLSFNYEKAARKFATEQPDRAAALLIDGAPTKSRNGEIEDVVYDGVESDAGLADDKDVQVAIARMLDGKQAMSLQPQRQFLSLRQKQVVASVISRVAEHAASRGVNCLKGVRMSLDMLRMADDGEDGGRWITIGAKTSKKTKKGNPRKKEKKVGGVPVYVKDGKIVKGPAKMVGNAPDKPTEKVKGDDKATQSRELEELKSKYQGPFGPATETPPQPGTKEFNKDQERKKELTEKTGKAFWQRRKDAIKTATGMPEAKHRQYVKDAIEAGKDVPQEVLDDYPDLAAKAKERDAKGEPDFSLKRESATTAKKPEFGRQEKTKQKGMFSGMDALPGQQDLFDDLDKVNEGLSDAESKPKPTAPTPQGKAINDTFAHFANHASYEGKPLDTDRLYYKARSMAGGDLTEKQFQDEILAMADRGEISLLEGDGDRSVDIAVTKDGKKYGKIAPPGVEAPKGQAGEGESDDSDSPKPGDPTWWGSLSGEDRSRYMSETSGWWERLSKEEKKAAMKSAGIRKKGGENADTPHELGMAGFSRMVNEYAKRKDRGETGEHAYKRDVIAEGAKRVLKGDASKMPIDEYLRKSGVSEDEIKAVANADRSTKFPKDKKTGHTVKIHPETQRRVTEHFEANAKKQTAKPKPINQSAGDAYEALANRREFEDGVVEIPRLYNMLKRENPGLTQKEFHNYLKTEAAKDREGGPQLRIANERQNVDEAEGIEGPDGGLLYYVYWPEKLK